MVLPTRATTRDHAITTPTVGQFAEPLPRLLRIGATTICGRLNILFLLSVHSAHVTICERATPRRQRTPSAQPSPTTSEPTVRSYRVPLSFPPALCPRKCGASACRGLRQGTFGLPPQS